RRRPRHPFLSGQLRQDQASVAGLQAAIRCPSGGRTALRGLSSIEPDARGVRRSALPAHQPHSKALGGGRAGHGSPAWRTRASARGDRYRRGGRLSGEATMIFTETALKGAYVIDLERRSDERGFFARAFCQKEFAAHGLKTVIAQANIGSN